MLPSEFRDALEEQSVNLLSIKLSRLLPVIGDLEKLRVLLDSDHLYVQRTVGLARGTSKEDPLDCPYVLRALREMFVAEKDISELKDLLVRIHAAIITD